MTSVLLLTASLLLLPEQAPPIQEEDLESLLQAPAEQADSISGLLVLNPSTGAVADGVYLLTADWCPYCPGAIKNATKSGEQITVVDFDKFPDLCKKLLGGNDMNPPCWVKVHNGKTIHVWYGPSYPDGVKSMARFNTPVLINSPAPMALYVGPDTHPGHWTYPDSIIQHLVNGHGYSLSQLRGLNQEQLLTLHDQTHEEGLKQFAPRLVNYRNTPAFRPVYRSTCPNCPR